MKSLIYLNLFIDNDWDKDKVLDKIFSIKLDSSKKILDSYLQWGIFEGGKGDIVIVENKVDISFRKYLERYFELPDECLQCDLDKIDFDQITDFKLVGVSDNEERLLLKKSSGKRKYLEAKDYERLNRKDFLYHLANKLKCSFPQSHLISLDHLIDLKNQTPLPYVIKFLSSAGGRGVFKISEKNLNLISFFKMQLGEDLSDVTLLKQEYLEVLEHFYTFAETDFSDENFGGYLIDYDNNNSSKRHSSEKNISDERRLLAMEIARELKKKGYRGPFGFDGVRCKDGSVFFAIDLNVRLDKSRLIYNLSRKFKINDLYYEFRRERFQGRSYECFEEYWIKREDSLLAISRKYSDRYQVIPVLISNMFHPEQVLEIVEVSFFVVCKTEKTNDWASWLRELYSWLGIPRLEVENV